MAYQLKKLQAAHREILRLHVTGLSNLEIANELGFSLPSVVSAINCDIGQMVIEDMQKTLDAEALEVNSQLYQNAKEAEVFLGRIVRGDEPATQSLRARVCMDQLDRAGYPKVTKNVNLDIHGKLTEEEIMSIKAEARRLRNTVIEVDAATDAEAYNDPPPPNADCEEVAADVADSHDC